MKPGTFQLNPYAASYVPLSKRGGGVGGGEPVCSVPPTHLALSQQHIPSKGFTGQGVKKPPGSEVSMANKSSEMTYKQMRDGDLEMEMEIDYLLMTFPGLSHESIVDVYLVNDSDLEATIDMLSQLEIYASESQESLPESLDIGDVSETGPSTSFTSKQRNAATEAAASSSGNCNKPVSS